MGGARLEALAVCLWSCLFIRFKNQGFDLSPLRIKDVGVGQATFAEEKSAFRPLRRRAVRAANLSYMFQFNFSGAFVDLSDL